MEDKNQLEAMVQASPLLSKENRAMVLGRIGIMSETEVGNLMNIFLMEKEKMMKIDIAFDTKEMALKSDYLNALTEFEHAGIQHALQVTEEHEETDKANSLEKILKGTEDFPKAKKHRFQFLLMAFVAVASLVYYFFFYAKTP